MKNLTADDVRALMRKKIAGRSYREAAKEFGVEHTYLYRMVTGERQPCDAILDALGLKRVTVYEKDC